MRLFKKVAIIGVGLMGGSLALALRERLGAIKIFGYTRNRTSYKKIKKLNIVDKVSCDIKEVIKDADCIVITAPIYATVKYLKVIKPYLTKGAIIVDLGSTKNYIQTAAKNILPSFVSFVGCHPLCGSEKSGAEFASPNLYKKAVCFITSSKQNKASRIIAQLWHFLGCRVIFITPVEHDKILGVVSHLPHAISFSFTDSVDKKYAKFIGPSFKDLTRISASSPNIWADIFFSNKNNIVNAIEKFINSLETLKKLVEKGVPLKLTNFINRVNKKQRDYF